MLKTGFSVQSKPDGTWLESPKINGKQYCINLENPMGLLKTMCKGLRVEAKSSGGPPNQINAPAACEYEFCCVAYVGGNCNQKTCADFRRR